MEGHRRITASRLEAERKLSLKSLWGCSPACSEADTSTAILKSTMETLVFLCQQTCTVVLPRWGAWRSSEVRDALRSSSDSWSTVGSSGDSMKRREKPSLFSPCIKYRLWKHWTQDRAPLKHISPNLGRSTMWKYGEGVEACRNL